MLKKLCLSLLVLALLSSCITIPNGNVCTVAGSLSAGMICAETLSGKTSEMTLEQAIEFLEPQVSPTPIAGAMCMSAADWNALKTALEKACRELGSKCSYEAKKALNIEQSDEGDSDYP